MSSETHWQSPSFSRWLLHHQPDLLRASELPTMMFFWSFSTISSWIDPILALGTTFRRWNHIFLTFRLLMLRTSSLFLISHVDCALQSPCLVVKSVKSKSFLVNLIFLLFEPFFPGQKTPWICPQIPAQADRSASSSARPDAGWNRLQGWSEKTVGV